MRWKEQFAEARRQFYLLSFYEKFEHIVIAILTGLIALFVVFAVWNLALKLFQSIASSGLDPTDYTVFQSVFGAILTVIIALEFKATFRTRPSSQGGASPVALSTIKPVTRRSRRRVSNGSSRRRPLRMTPMLHRA